MTADIRNMAAAATLGRNGQPANRAQQAATVREFDHAEQEFGRLAEQNGVIHRLLNSRGEGAIATLLGSAGAKGGNVALLAQLRNSMQPADFQMIGGVLLHELGQNPSTGEFSLVKFETNFNKVAPHARAVLFSPQHLRNIEEVAGLGSHIKRALRESNNSHTAGVLMMFDLARDAILFGATAATGALTAGSIATGALATPGVVFAHWLSSPARASSMANWMRARAGMLGHPTPARLGAFNIATRNLANNLGLPLESLTKHLTVAEPPQGGRDEDRNPK